MDILATLRQERRKVATSAQRNSGCDCCIKWPFTRDDRHSQRGDTKEENDVPGGPSQDFKGDDGTMGEV
jgi:hypothetical protein